MWAGYYGLTGQSHWPQGGSHACLWSAGFAGDVQASLIDMPFDGSRLFGDKADTVLERFKESWVRDRSLGLATASHLPQSSFRSHRAMGEGTDLVHSTCRTLRAIRLPSLSWVPRSTCSPDSRPHHPPQPPSPFSVPSSMHTHPVGSRIGHYLPRWQAITSDKWVLQIVQQGYALLFLEIPPPLSPSVDS